MDVLHSCCMTNEDMMCMFYLFLLSAETIQNRNKKSCWVRIFVCVHFLLIVNICMLWRLWRRSNIILVGIQYSSYVNSTQLSQLHIPSPNHNFLLSPSKQINALSQDKNPGWQSSITFSLSGGRCKTHIIGNNTTKRQFSCRFSLPDR